MTEQNDGEEFSIWKRYLKGAFIIGLLMILGSCVYRIDSLGGHLDTNQRMAAIFFFHTFLIFPCLFGLFVYGQLKLEKYIQNSKGREAKNRRQPKE